jgi:16S rRNA (guanine527-N7)-methyltransferase
VALELPELCRVRSLADLGSGAGMPGAVLAVALPGCEVRLVESQSRRCGFLRELLRAAELANASVVCARAEQWRAGLGAQEAVTARALAPQPVVLEYAAPLLALGGVLVDWRGRRDGEEERAAGRAAERLGLEPAEIRQVDPYPRARELHLHVFVKRAETPAGFPRRPGVARKRPLGR